MYYAPCTVFAVDTTIKGGRMELLEKGERVVFNKGVRLVRGTDTMTANKMVTNKKRDKVTATGNVKLRRELENEEWLGFGRKGFYDTESGKGYILGGRKKAKMVYIQVVSSTVTRKMDVFAEKFDFFREEQKAIGTGKVYGKTIDPESGELYEFWSEKAIYNGDTKRLVLSGEKQPRVHQTLGEAKKKIRGNEITYYVEEERFISDGASEAILMDPVEKETE